MFLKVLHEEVSWQWLSNIGMKVHKPANNGIGNSDDAEQIPEINTAHSNTCERISSKSDDWYKENMCCQSIVLQRVIVSYELVVLVADLGTFSSGVAVGDAWKVDVCVYISSHEVEDVLETAATFRADLATPVAAGVSMAGEELNEEGWDLKVGVKEGSSCNTTPVFSD